MARPKNFKLVSGGKVISARAAKLLGETPDKSIAVCPKCKQPEGKPLAGVMQYGFWGTSGWEVLRCVDCGCVYWYHTVTTDSGYVGIDLQTMR